MTDARRAEAGLPAPDGWLEYVDWRGERGTVAGRLLVRPAVRSPELGNERHLLVHVPPSLDRGGSRTGRRFPVLYMHDGQNLFDAGTGENGEWRVDETMQLLARDRTEAIVVGIPNGEVADPADELARAYEYSPYPAAHPGGRADDYLGFLAGTVKPLVDRTFPTLPEPAATGLAGSSLGGLISLYGVAVRSDVFGFAGVFSPAFWFDDGRVLREHAPSLRPPLRLYVDVGGQEGSHEDAPAEQERLSRVYLRDARAVRDLLVRNGFEDGDDLLYVEDPDAPHHETAWADRLPGALRFLLRPWARGPA